MPTLRTLVSFKSSDGASPEGALITDAAGNLFGTTAGGGPLSYGTVFEITDTAGSYASTPMTIAAFSGFPDGSTPVSNLIADSDGNLFGTTVTSANNDGTVFEIVKTANGYASAPTTLVTFNGANGKNPYAGLILDASGNLFGTTALGGTSNLGTVFEIAKTGGSYASAPTTLASFNGTNGQYPYGSLFADSSGNLFGTTNQGGASSKGTIFEIARTGGTYATAPTTLASFSGANGANSRGGLIADSDGNLFGTTQGGGAGSGTVFELANLGGSYASAPTTLVTFNNTNGRFPTGNLIMDTAGNLFGTTQSGGANGQGTVFRIARTGGGYASTPTTLVDFNGTNGATPYAALLGDSGGHLFGTTYGGGANSAGTVFEIVGGGFVACFLAGTRIATPDGEVAVQRLVPGQFVMAAQPGGEPRAQPVKWIGGRRIDLDAHPQPELVAPVRIVRGAFAEGIPHRDLLLSPDHAILVDGMLVCARQLINGTTIRQEPGHGVIEYFHVEMESHAILLAEGLPTESYLDTGNRGVFANGGAPVVLHPDLGGDADRAAREAASCAPFVWAGERVRPVWQRLAERAGALGDPMAATTADPSLRVTAGHRVLRPLHVWGGRYQFLLPRGTRDIHLVSHAATPADLRPWLDDRRRLGLYVERIVLRSGTDVHDIAVDHPALGAGWWDVERSGTSLRRWTNGDARLALPRMDGHPMLEIRACLGAMRYPLETAAGIAA